ncbi:hypothetical protein ENBRE01_1598 [Enteropsectra breve]|nr:hypothetical protein ENBRE01_1598 [Enteropsectra breve]
MHIPILCLTFTLLQKAQCSNEPNVRPSVGQADPFWDDAIKQQREENPAGFSSHEYGKQAQNFQTLSNLNRREREIIAKKKELDALRAELALAREKKNRTSAKLNRGATTLFIKAIR